jgi:HD-GYP domain-containing protein (c-di-GMP phosphodiesterase class II)
MLVIMLIIFCINALFDLLLFRYSNQTKDNYEIILNQYIKNEEDMFRVSQLMYEMQSFTLSQIVSNDQETIEQYAEKIIDLDDEILTLLDSYGKNITDQEESDTFHSLYSCYVNYKDMQEAAANMNKKDSLETAHYYVNTVMETELSNMNEYLDRIYTLTEERISVVHNSIIRNNQIMNWIIGVFALISVVVIFVLLLIFRRLSDNIVLSFDREQQEHKERVMHMQQRTIENMAELVENRDGSTGAHIRNTAFYVDLIAKKLAEDSEYKNEMTEEYITSLRQFAPLHDVGKIVVPDSILLKPGKLSPGEFEQMKRHTVEGGRIIDSMLTDIETDEHLQIARNIATCHHEKWDGTGYPLGLSGTNIPLCARVMAVADVFDALISKRCYKEAFTLSNAYDIIENAIGTQFDPIVGNAFLSLRPVIENYLSSNNNNEVAS